MWTCVHCGCQAIAGSLTACPQCHTSREDGMPKITSGGATNAAEGLPSEPGAQPAPAATPAPATVPAATPAVTPTIPTTPPAV